MKRITRLYCPFFILLSLHASSQDLMGVWSGTMSYDEKWDGITGSSEKHIRLSIKNNTVTGSITGWEKNAKELGGGQCTLEGNGQGEAWRIALNMDGTYDIEIISPKYSCVPGGRVEEELSVSASGQIVNRNLLSGTKTTDISRPEMGTGSRVVTWNLHRVTGLELIVTPRQYDDWLPEPGKDELTPGNTITVDLKIISADGSVPNVKAKSFKLELVNTSHEPGITLNMPLHPLNDLHDIGFLSNLATAAGPEVQNLVIDCNKCLTATARLAAYDGGAYTTLLVKAIMEDNSELEGMLNSSGGIHEIPIPKRPRNSRIASKWLDANNNPADSDDGEESAGNPNNGDGLSAYEEYRGVISKGRFTRLEGQKKDLGIWGKEADLNLFSDGLDWFENASGLHVIRFYFNEINTDRQLNRNNSTLHLMDQFVLRLEKSHVRKNVLGRTEPGPGLPAMVTRVKIDYDQIFQRQLETEQEARRQNVQLPFTLEEMVAKTVAHELGHGVNIQHHGNEELKEINREIRKEEPIRIFGTHNNEFTDRPYLMKGVVGTKGNQESGDIFCIMNYNPSFDWALNESGGTYYFYLVPLIPLGTIFCTDADGTDINKKDSSGNNNYFSDATLGNCIQQIKLK